MSCVHYQSSDPPRRDRSYFDVQYPQYRYTSSYATNVASPETYRSGCYSGYRGSEIAARGTGLRAARGDTLFPDAGIQTARITGAYKHDAPRRQCDATSGEKVQAKLKFLEESNTAVQTRNQSLIAENKGLTSQLEEERNEVKRLEKRVTSLRGELDREKSKLKEAKKEAQLKQLTPTATIGTSTINVSKIDRGVQIWAVCKGCQRKLESCEKEPPSVTITQSELENLEKDMQTLRDTIIAREEAWDEAMEREQNYREQLTRLTAETITARHLSETREEELQATNQTLSERESELKTTQKDNLFLNKLIAKLYNRHQRRLGDNQGCNAGLEISEKDQKIIEEIVRRVCTTKIKQKSKPRSGYSERTAHSGIYPSSPRDNKLLRAVKDQAGSLREPKH